MHICFITNEYPKASKTHGGIGTFVQNIAAALVKNGVRVSVVGTGSSQTAEQFKDGGTSIYLTARSTWSKAKFWQNWKRMNTRLAEIHAINPIDFVETCESDLAWIKKLKGIQYVIRMNGGHHFFAHTAGLPTKPWRAFQEKRSFARADKLIAVSHFVNNETAKYLSFDPSKTIIIPNAIDVEKFSPNPSIPVDEHTLIFAGTLVEKKGIRQLLMAMPLVCKKHPQAQLHVYGADGKVSGTTDSYKQYLTDHVPADCFVNVTFEGRVENTLLPGIISAAFACVYPSHMEALPLAWLEAMAMGKPFIGSKTGPGPEVVQHGIDGLLVDPFDPTDIAAKIIYLFDHPDEAKKLGQAAREKMVANFDMEKVVKRNLETYIGWLPADKRNPIIDERQ